MRSQRLRKRDEGGRAGHAGAAAGGLHQPGPPTATVETSATQSVAVGLRALACTPVEPRRLGGGYPLFRESDGIQISSASAVSWVRYRRRRLVTQLAWDFGWLVILWMGGNTRPTGRSMLSYPGRLFE